VTTVVEIINIKNTYMLEFIFQFFKLGGNFRLNKFNSHNICHKINVLRLSKWNWL